MRANEMISCEFRSDGFHVTAYRHDGRIVASSFHLQGVGDSKDEWKFLIDGGKREFTDEQDVRAFARDTILPCIMRKIPQQITGWLTMAPIRVCVCEMSIGQEQPKLYGLITLIGLFLMSLCSYSADAATNSFNGVQLEYDFVDDGARIIQISQSLSSSSAEHTIYGRKEMILPDCIDGMPVVDIGTNAFYGLSSYNGSYRSSVTNYCLPRNLKRIHAGAFAGIAGYPNEIRFPRALDLLDEMFGARKEYGKTTYSVNFSGLKNWIFDGPPPTMSNELNGAFGTVGYSYIRYAPLGNPSVECRVFVNDLYYDQFLAKSESGTYSNDSSTKCWATGYYYLGALLCRGMPGLRILPESRTLYKGDNSQVLLACTNANAIIYYTLDGSEPQTNETQTCFKYDCPIELFHPATVKAIAVAPDYPYYTVEEKSFSIDQPGMPVVGAVDQTPFIARDYLVQISTSDDGVIIRYTTDGFEVTEKSRAYSGPFTISDTTTVRAKAFAAGRFASEEAIMTFTREWHVVETPVIEPCGATFANVSQEVSISCTTEGATIFYTTDGSDPAVNGLEYKKPFSVYSSCTVRAVAVKDDWKDSAVATSELVRAESLSEAANFYGYTMESGVEVPWTVATDISHDGVSSIRSGMIDNNGVTTLTASVRKAGTVSFWWRAACEDADEEDGADGYYDYGVFLVDDVAVARIAGHDGEWHHVLHEIPKSGKHVLKWEYRKDDATSYAPDCVWVDQVQWIPVDGSGYTLTTPEPVPYSWLDEYRLGVETDYETAGNAASGKVQGWKATRIWEEYVAGTDPTNEASRLEVGIEMRDGAPFVTWKPNLNEGGIDARVYTIWGKTNLSDRVWHSPTNESSRFFKVTVELP